MKSLTLTLLLLITFMVYAQAPADVTLMQDGKEVKDKISLKSGGKLEIVMPEGWRYISGKVKILKNDEVRKEQQVTGDAQLKELNLLQFIKLNAVPGDNLSLEFSVRTKESSKFFKKRIPIE